MEFLGLLVKKFVEIVDTDEEGRVKKDRNGNPRRKIIESKNYRIANVHKNSKTKSYFVEEPVYKQYIEITKNKNKL